MVQACYSSPPGAVVGCLRLQESRLGCKPVRFLLSGKNSLPPANDSTLRERFRRGQVHEILWLAWRLAVGSLDVNARGSFV